eukprot:g2128.t1
MRSREGIIGDDAAEQLAKRAIDFDSREGGHDVRAATSRAAASMRTARSFHIEKSMTVDAKADQPALSIKTTLKPYSGDKFSTAGSTSDGMLYLSRMPAEPQLRGRQAMRDTLAGDGEANTAQMRKEDAEDSHDEDGQIMSTEEKLAAKEMRARQRMYLTALCSLSWQAEARPRITSKGATHALGVLADHVPQWKTMDSRALRSAEDIACTLSNLADEASGHDQMVREGAVRILTSLARKQKVSLSLLEDCVAALCKLSAEPGNEGALVSGGVYPLIMSHIFRPATSDTVVYMCSMIMLNISCMERSFDTNDHLMEAIKTLIEFLDVHGDVQQNVRFELARLMCLRALCNLSSHREYQGRIVEEGAVRVFAKHQKQCPQTRFYIASMLASLARSRPTQAGMVKQRVTPLLLAMSDTQTAFTSRLSQTSLNNLGEMKMRDSISGQMRKTKVGRMTTGCEDPHVLIILYQSLYNMSLAQQSLATMVEQGAMDLLWLQCDNDLTMSEHRKQAPVGEDVRECVALTLVNLASGRVNSERMLRDGAGQIICDFILKPEVWMSTADCATQAPQRVVFVNAKRAEQVRAAAADDGQQRLEAGKNAAFARLPKALSRAREQRDPESLRVCDANNLQEQAPALLTEIEQEMFKTGEATMKEVTVVEDVESGPSSVCPMFAKMPWTGIIQTTTATAYLEGKDSASVAHCAEEDELPSVPSATTTDPAAADPTRKNIGSDGGLSVPAGEPTARANKTDDI